ncbi:MAG: peptide chain release factor 2 [Proteobacteria bacterium]|nr:peptide chain release factor 2 [Pseudomonadota bacterium]
MVDLHDLTTASRGLKEKFVRIRGFFDLERKADRLRDIESQIELTPDFWTNPKVSAPILKEKKALELALNQVKKLEGDEGDLDAAIELAGAGESDYIAEAESLYTELSKHLRVLEVQSLLSGETDMNAAILTINAGAGGTESCDWASILMRMYLRYAERKGWQADVHDILSGEEAGVKNATIEITGDFAYGLLKAENGVHRLVRISPFDSNARRHTSFASVFVAPVVDDTIEIDINPSDLKIDTYRASGAGGQHVNKTDSAVRITHMPSGIVTASQTQRSQVQNKENAMKLLRSALYEREMEKRRAAQTALENTKTDISFGHQIRSYVLHPYKLIKDHRTDYESHSPDEVLDGKLDDFVNEFLAQSKESEQGSQK